MLKRSEVDCYVPDAGQKYYTVKDKERERVERRVITQERRLLPNKKVKLYVRSINKRCKCVRVSEIYPTRTFQGELKDFELRAV